jgi:hypothetical protein
VVTRIGLKPITAIMQTPNQEVVRWGLREGTSIMSTPDHPVFITKKPFMKAVKDLTFSDLVLRFESASIPLMYRIPQKELMTVYNITVDEAHEYYANDVLVSNCDAARYAIATMEIKVLKHNILPPKDNVIVLPNWVASPLR